MAVEPERVLGRVLKVVRLKSVSFLHCRVGAHVVQCVLPPAVAPCPAPGSQVALRGAWQACGRRRGDLHADEFVVTELRVLAVPADDTWRAWEQPQRRHAVRMRGVAILAAERFLRRSGCTRIETPLVMGSEARAGTTWPFRIRHGGQAAHLAVSNIVNQTRWMAAGFERVYQTSRLFWAQHFKNRFSLSEFALIEYSLAGGSCEALIAFTEVLLEEVRAAVLEAWPAAGGAPQTLRRSLAGLPVLDHAEVLRRAAGALVTEGGHVLPAAVDARVCAQTGQPGFWCVNAPPEASPYYTRHAELDGRRVARSCELRLAGVPDVGSGSEWNSDADEAERRVRAWPDPAAGASYVTMLRRGLPAAAGFSLGLDRLVMFLLGETQIGALVVEPRRQQSFPGAPAWAVMDPPVPLEPDARRRIPEVDAAVRAWKAVRAALEALEREGFLPAVTSLLTEDDAPPGAPAVDWYGREVRLAGVQLRRHHVLVAAGSERVLEIGPAFPGTEAWWHPGWRLQVCWVTLDLDEVWGRARDVLRIVVDEWADVEPGLRQALSALPSRPDKSTVTTPAPGVPPADRPTGRTPDALDLETDARRGRFRWSWRDRTVLAGGLWSPGPEVEAEASVGKEGCSPSADDTFQRAAPPAIGGFTLFLDEGLKLPWGVGLKPPEPGVE